MKSLLRRLFKDFSQTCETGSYIFKLSHHRSAHNQCLLVHNREAT